MDAWCTAVLEWVNCLDILDANVNDLKELQDGKFYSKLIKILSQKESEDDYDDKDLLSRFIQDTYPEFFRDDEGSEENCKEIYVASLLLLHSSQEPKLHRPMCIKLRNETQLKIKSFLEKVLQYGSSIRKYDINIAIKETEENLVRTPPVTPKMRPLKDFFNSPVTTVRKNYNRMMDQRTRELRSLKAELETERFEKADLREDLKIQREKNISLQKKLQEKIAEIKNIREESVCPQTPQSSKKKKEVKTPRNRVSPKVQTLTDEISLLKSEIGNLEEEKQLLMRKLLSVERHCVTLKDRSEMNERNLETLLIQEDIKDQEIEELKSHNEELRAHIEEMQRRTIAEQSFEMEMTALSPSVNSLNGSELLSSVIEIQLQEAKEECEVLKSQLENLNNRLQSAQEENQTLQDSNETLEAEVSLLRSTKQKLSEVRKELGEYIEMSNTLEQEKLYFQEETKKFETLFLTKEKLFKQSEQQNESLMIRLRDLEDELRITQESLSKENTTVKNLETVISQKDEILKTESLKYSCLDQQHSILNREKLDLLEEIRDLKNSVSLKEGSLKEVQQQREILELDLHSLKGELRTVQDSLSAERSAVKNLESIISQTKLEHEESLRVQLLKYQALEEKYINLEEENLRLLRETDDLNLRIASNENQLTQSFQKNQDLTSDLQGLNDKLKTAQRDLAEEENRVDNLKSTITQIEIDKREFIENQLSKYKILEGKYASLEEEKLNLIRKIDDLNNVVTSTKQLLKQSLEERENLESISRELNNKLRTAEGVLNDERTRVKDLETAITNIKHQTEDTLQHQLKTYHALEKKHVNLEQEKLDLLKDTENLRNLISSKDELLAQSQQHNANLQRDLCDAKNEIKTVQSELFTTTTKVNSLESVLAQTKLKMDKIIQTNKSLSAEINLLNSAQHDLCEVKEKLHKQNQELEQEKLRLLKEIDELKTYVSSKEELLTQTQLQNETLHSKLNDLCEEVKSAQNLLNAKSTRVEDLESAISDMIKEKEETVRNQSMKYEALEKMHTKINEEKLDILKSSENLKNMLSSKEELLQRSQQHSAKLEIDLCSVKNKINTVQVELDMATTKVESLECVLAQTKLQTDKLMQTNENLCAKIDLLNSVQGDLCEVKKQLHKQNQKLHDEKLHLLEGIDKLKTHVLLKEELLIQTQQQNDTLQSKLNNLGEEVKSIQNLLDVKSSRITDLESTVTRINQEREETLQRQLISYQALEKIYTNVKEEKLNMLKDLENFRNLLSTKEDLLQQSQEHKEKLEFDLSSLKDEIKTKQNVLDAATIKITNLESVQAQTKLEMEKIIQTNKNLSAEIRFQKSRQQDLCEAKEQLHKQNQELQQEKSRLLEEINTLKTYASSKEETLKSQLISYRALEEMHTNVKQEKLDLSKDTENLKNLLLSKEELLLKLQQHNAKLQHNLNDVQNEMKTVQDELATATTKINSLESVLAETKLKTDKAIQTNENLYAEISSLKSTQYDLCEVKEQLLKQSRELDQEKLHLTKEIDELKTCVSLKEETLQETQQRNNILQSKLINLNEKVESVQNSLTEKNTRLEHLESVVVEIESEKKQDLSIIQQLKLENVEHKNLIQSCSLILTELVKCSGQLTGDETSLGDLTILDLSKQLKTLINSLEVIFKTKDSELKNFEASVSTLNLTVSELKADIIHFEEMKIKNDQIISGYLKEITDLKAIAKEKEILLEDMAELQKQLSNEEAKSNLLNKEKKLLGQNLIDIKRSLISLKNDKLILLQNVENQNEDLLTKIASVSQIIIKMQNQIELDNNTILRLSEEKALLASKYNEENKVRTDLEMKCELLENDNKCQTKEKKELKDKLNVIRVRNAKLEKNLDELRKENKKLETEKPCAEDQSKIEELNTSISKLQLQIQELEAEKIELSKRPTQQDFDSRIKEVHIEYDQKLEKIKQKMKTAYNEQMAKVGRDQERLMQEKQNAQKLKMEEQCRKHAEEITRYKEHVTKLSSDYWDVGEKLLVEKQQKENLARQLQDLMKHTQYGKIIATNVNMSQPVSTSRSKTSSLDRRDFGSITREEVSASRTVETIKEEYRTCARRESIQSVQTIQGMGNAFKVEDEEGEVFNTNYLADMKAGRCSDAPDLERLSVLQMRNAQCKPHLKSSYPAETQFQPGTFTEEEIKSGSALEDIFNDSLSQSLLPGEKTKKRDRTQTLYKRPGPPTPSKNGGRLSLQGNELKSPNSRILRERNVERRSTATPRRLKDLFGGSSRRQDENVSGTPKGRRLSSIFRKPK